MKRKNYLNVRNKNNFLIKKVSSRYWKNVLTKGLISKEDLDVLKSLDPSPTKKYLDFLVKLWIKEKPNIDELRNYIEEFDTLVERHNIPGIDINRFNSYDDFKNFVNNENERASANVEEFSNDYEIVRNDDDLFIVIPFSHAASKKLGIKYFSVRETEDPNVKNCPWCTAYNNPEHFKNYFYVKGLTLYYIKVKNPEMLKKIRALPGGKYLENVALYEYPDGSVGMSDSQDASVSENVINKFRSIVGI